MLIPFILGVVIGLILALTGAGGGIIAVPLLVFALNLSITAAAPIALLAVSLSAALGAGMGLKAGTVRYKAAMLIAGIGMLFSPIGLWLAHQLDMRLLGFLLAFILLFIAYRAYQQTQQKIEDSESALTRKTPCTMNQESGRFIWKARCAWALAFCGAVSGFLSGLLGVGGGFIINPALKRLTTLTTDSIVTTSLAVITLISLANVGASLLSNQLNLAIALPFSFGTLAGMLSGRIIAPKIPSKRLQQSFASIAVIAAVMLIIKNLSLL